MVNQKNMSRIRIYKQVIYRALKLANHYGIDPVIIPLDFVCRDSKLEQKMGKVIGKIVGVIK